LENKLIGHFTDDATEIKLTLEIQGSTSAS